MSLLNDTLAAIESVDDKVIEEAKALAEAE